jgi:para-nitrobenzyl esterase
VIVRLPEGTAEGDVRDGVRHFLGLPYAAPMTNERRFRAPEAVEPWEGVRDATRPGPRAPQNPTPPMDIDIDALMGKPVLDGPDYLTLNVYAPDGQTGARPVMVFIHGGSFVAGSKDAPVYDGSAFARDGVVCVVINYRLGIEGFLPIAGVPTNLGLRDMIAALKWIRERIVLFGGDPENVTLFGESGGAYCIAALMTSPLTVGLFHRAICQSGHVFVSRDLSVMQRITHLLAKRLRISPDRAGFLSCSSKQLLAAQDRIMQPSLWLDMRDEKGWDPSFGITRFLPVHGDDVLPKPAIEALRQGAGRGIQLLIGTTTEEANLFFVPGNVRAKINRIVAYLFLRRAIPRPWHALRVYGIKKKGAKAGEVLSRALTDLMFRWMARRTAEIHHGHSYVYEFDWRSPAFDGELGAAHAVELPFVFDTLECASGPRGLLGSDPPRALAEFIHSLWIRFATDGTAPWPEFDTDRRQVYSLTRQTAEYEAPMPAASFLP